MQNIRLLAVAIGTFVTLAALSAMTAPAQALFINSPTAQASHIGVRPYMRIPVGSRGEAAALKADQDAAKLATQPRKKGRKAH